MTEQYDDHDRPKMTIYMARQQLKELLNAQKTEYDSWFRRMDKFADQYMTKLETLAKKKKEVIFRFKFRVKKWPSLCRKLESGRVSYWSSCPDLLGFKLIVLSSDMIDDIIFNLQKLRRPNTQSRRYWHSSVGRAKGYSATHFQIDLPKTNQIPKETRNAGAELQVLTELQEAWDSVTHDDFYKSKRGVPINVRHRIHRLAAAIDLLDAEMQGVRQSLFDTLEQQEQIFKKSVANSTAEWENVALDEVNLLLSSENQLRDNFVALRKLADDCGFRCSAWPELVRCGEEMDLLLELAEQLPLQRICDLTPYFSVAEKYRPYLRKIAASVEEIEKESFSLFNRPLFVLTIIILLRNPGVPGVRFKTTINKEIRRVAAELEKKKGKSHG